jgi:molybdate transport system substrate-binding protein
MKLLSVYWLLFFAIFVTTVSAEEIRISAAASMTDSLKELISQYSQDHPETKLLANFASSGALVKQVMAGAPADIYISANPKWMDYLDQNGMVVTASRQILVHNQLVVVGWSNSVIHKFLDLLSLERIAIGSPQTTPVGKYSQQALTAAGIYPQLVAERKLIMAKDVRQALMYADRGEVDGAFVYRTDALLAQKAFILLDVPQELYPPVVYPVALTTSAGTNDEAKKFLAYLLGAEARQIFHHYGFITPQ